MNKNEEFNCPCCGKPLDEFTGGRNRKDGYTLFCNNIECKSNEQPTAFGRSKKAAYNTLVYKYGPRDKKNELMVEDVETENEVENVPDSTDSKLSNE